jgi:two-component system, NtrC family, sensor histidine kinase HydH
VCLKADNRLRMGSRSKCYDRCDMSPSTDWRLLCRALASDATRIGGLLLAIVAISLLHSATNQSEVIWHGLLLRLYYIPVLVGAYWYGAFGGLLVALTCSMAYVPHLREQSPALEAGRYAEIVVFHVIGLTVGLLATAQRRVTERYQHAAETLESANLELRESSEQLQRADRLKTLGEVAAGLAHEIRHPLASIRGALEIIAERSRPDSPEAEFSRLAMAEVQRLDNLVWEFLRYARPHEPDLRPTSLHDVVQRVVALLRVEAERCGVMLDVDRSVLLPDASIDALQIEQVLLNVILNAIQASARGSCVRVREQLDRKEVVVDVIDEGRGIPVEDQTRVFSPFFTTKEQGTGLGLAIAHRIVSAHEGRIEVHTSASGTCVRIRLPIGASRATTLSGGPRCTHD